MNPLSLLNQLDSIIPTAITGTVQETTGTTISVSGFPVPVGALAEIRLRDRSTLSAEVIRFHDETAILYPLQTMQGIRRGDRVRLVQTIPWLTVGEGMLGKVLDARGRILQDVSQCIKPLDSHPAETETDADPIFSGSGTPAASGIPCRSTSSRSTSETKVSEFLASRKISAEALLNSERIPFHRDAPKAFQRPRITNPISTGVRAIDALLTLGEGQRVGIFAGSGVGKSTLLGMIARYTNADVIVIGLVGERGREVNDFLERDLGAEGRKRSVVIAATSNEPAILRVRAAQTATAVAEYFRDKGKNVLLLMDSLTRFAMAQREIGLAIGEPPVSRGYTPSIYTELPKLLERSGNFDKGSITGVYTVLVEGDDTNEPISDTVRGILDGHIILSRALANANHYPAVDVSGSVSRLMTEIVSPEHRQLSSRIRDIMSVYERNADLVSIGAYKPGSNHKLDFALTKIDAINNFLTQQVDESFSYDQCVEMMENLLR